MTDDIYEFPLTLRVPKSAFVVVAPEPATVTQRTVEQHFGIPPRTYRAMVRDGLFPVKRIGHLIFATYEDVKRAVTEGAVTRATVGRALAKSVVQPEEAPLAVDAAFAYLESSRSARERRQRTKEISEMGWELALRYGETIDDDSPNPKHDKARYDHGMDLVFASMGLVTQGNVAVGSSSQPRRDYGTCCWCDRPGYATKQTWRADSGSWSGGPVCIVCARNRAANERVVDVMTETILLPARDPTVPAEYDAPRRGRRRRPPST